MTIQQLLAWVNVVQILVPAGIATEQQIAAFIKSLHPGLSDAGLNAILDLLIASASRHKATAEKDAAGG